MSDIIDPQEAMSASTLVSMSTTDLVKLINDEYDLIQAAEVEVGSKILKRARQVAYKLAVLREKSKILGQWKVQFAEFGLTISYETAALYLRLFYDTQWCTLLDLAEKAGVDSTHLTIERCRQLLAIPKKPKTSTTNTTNTNTNTDSTNTTNTSGESTGGESTNTSGGDGGESTGSAGDTNGGEGDPLNVEFMFEQLTKAYAKNQDDLKALTRKLCEHVGLRCYEPSRPTSPPSEKPALN